MSLLTIGVAIAACAHLAAEERPPHSANSPTVQQPAGGANPDSNVALAELRLREGTRLKDVAGRFRQNGDTLTFIDAHDREIGGLPNLNLERILRTLKGVEEPESITWRVNGAITEFGGRNYLLVTRAVYKAAAPPPMPESVDE